MCGICGQYNFSKQEPVRQETIRRMTSTMFHRGPDDEGYHLSGPLGLGFRRLSIIDLAGGHQPMSDREKSVWIVFNGEIYNYLELRAELEVSGHVFRTKSDTEVIIHGYKQWGDDVFNHLNGMFGVAIWDEQRKRLIMARDPMGIKLLYYRIENGSVSFGSEIRPLLANMHVKPDLNPTAVNMFLRYRYTPSPFTLYSGVRKLAPGTMVVVENGGHREERWYRFSPKLFSPMPTPDEAREHLLAIYKLAVKRHLQSDVPVGLLLSGGVDSGLLLGLMNLCGKNWPTYTVGYGESFSDDELSDAAETARLFSAKNISTELTREIFESALNRIVSCLEEPVASSSIVPMYFVCERARRDVKVALVGQGPDELFGGYSRHLGVRYGNYWRALPAWMRKSIETAINVSSRNETFKRGVYSLNVADRIKRYQHVFSLLPGEKIDGLFRDGVLGKGSDDAILKCWADLVPLMEDTDELGGLQFLEMRTSLPDELLMYADKLSMAHGLEVRVPFLDREIVEYVECLNASLKIKNGIRKWLHRKVCGDFLPERIINRKKRGFAVNVVDEWFQSSLGGMLHRCLFDEQSCIYQYLRPEVVTRLYQEHQSGKSDNHKLLFSLVVFEQWLRFFHC